MTVKRMTFLQDLLEFVGLGGRLHLEWISSAEARKFVRVVTDFTEKIREMGPSPVSDFTGKISAFLGPRPVSGAGGGGGRSVSAEPPGDGARVITA